MDLVTLARNMGKEIQNDEIYINYMLAQQACDSDSELQESIKEFNLKRALLNAEAQNPNADSEKLKDMNVEFRQLYAGIMKNESMARYNIAKAELDTLVQRITGIINLCSQGEDPESCDYDPSANSCGSGGCSGCSGCG